MNLGPKELGMLLAFESGRRLSIYDLARPLDSIWNVSNTRSRLIRKGMIQRSGYGREGKKWLMSHVITRCGDEELNRLLTVQPNKRRFSQMRRYRNGH